MIFFFLNISNIRSVTTNPPTTFNVPNINCKKSQCQCQVIICLRFSHHNNGSYYYNSMYGICPAHQRRMKYTRYSTNNFNTNKYHQYNYVNNFPVIKNPLKYTFHL